MFIFFHIFTRFFELFVITLDFSGILAVFLTRKKTSNYVFTIFSDW